MPIDELSFKYNMIPVYRDQASVIEAAKDIQFGEQLPMDLEVLPTNYMAKLLSTVSGEWRQSLLLYHPHLQEWEKRVAPNPKGQHLSSNRTGTSQM